MLCGICGGSVLALYLGIGLFGGLGMYYYWTVKLADDKERLARMRKKAPGLVWRFTVAWPAFIVTLMLLSEDYHFDFSDLPEAFAGEEEEEELPL